MQKVARVIIGISTSALNRLFTYAIPTDLVDFVEIGSVVYVPFGKGNSEKTAYVIDIGAQEKSYDYELKSIRRIAEEVSVEKEMIQLAYWMHRRYRCTLTSALKLMLPRDIDVKLLTRKTIIVRKNRVDDLKAYAAGIKNNMTLRKRHEILEFMENVIDHSDQDVYCFTEKDIITMFNTSTGVVKGIEKLGIIERVDEMYDRKIEVLEHHKRTDKLLLNPEQQSAVSRVAESLGCQETFLLHGVTGSGKTEVYLQLIEKVIEKGESAILLIPEIGLTPQTIRRFTERFGNVVGVMHSRLNMGERFEQWQKARKGDIRIMIGARSAIFTPFQDIGIIVIDEEHEHTYKSEQNPRYHAREIAIKRSLSHRCPVVLGSATPLVDNYYKAMESQFTLLKMHGRAVEEASKDVHVVDMRKELESGNRTILSSSLKEAIEQALLRGEQVILFLNRRGYANSISCRQCGYVHRCEHCDVSMTYHKSNGRLICHLCGASKPVQKTCPQCGSKYIRAFGAGTQKIEKYIDQLFEGAAVGRMDQDTTGTKHGHQKILDAFRNREIDILIGTQMIAKGHDFHNVTVVGVLMADLSLNVEDFRGAERTFQLITQVIGRTGRGSKKGSAYIQTYQPEHYAVTMAVDEDYEGFYNEEILFRKVMVYPPFCHLLSIVTLADDEYKGKDLLNQCVRIVQKMYEHEEDPVHMILGPAKTSIGKIKGKYRHRVIVKGSSYKKLTLVMKELYNRKDNDDTLKSIRLNMDLNPLSNV